MRDFNVTVVSGGMVRSNTSGGGNQTFAISPANFAALNRELTSAVDWRILSVSARLISATSPQSGGMWAGLLSPGSWPNAQPSDTVAVMASKGGRLGPAHRDLRLPSMTLALWHLVGDVPAKVLIAMAGLPPGADVGMLEISVRGQVRG